MRSENELQEPMRTSMCLRRIPGEFASLTTVCSNAKTADISWPSSIDLMAELDKT